MKYEYLRKTRKEKKISVKEIIKALKNLKTESAYYKKENGYIPFTIDECEKISNLLGEPIEELFKTDGRNQWWKLN